MRISDWSSDVCSSDLLEYEEVAGVEDGTQEFDIGHVWLGGRGFGGNVDAAGVPGGHREDDLGEKNQRQQRSERQIFGKARAEFGEVDVEHHDDEKEQHLDRAHIDDDKQHRDDLGSDKQQQHRRVEEDKDKPTNQ